MSILARLRNLFRRTRASQEDSEPLVSIVLLLREQRDLPEDVLRQAAARAWGPEFSGEESGNFVVGGPFFNMVKIRGLMLQVLVAARPYVDDPERAAKSIAELRCRKVMAEHTAWISVDCNSGSAPPSVTMQEKFSLIGGLAAELLNSNCTGLYVPWNNMLIPNEESLPDRLRTFASLEELWRPDQPPVPLIEDDDPRLLKAVAEARSRWPEFVEAFRQRKPGDTFVVKSCFSDEAGGEWMWVEVASVEGDEIRGVLGNRPVNVHSVSEGDEVCVRASEIGDWAYIRGEKRFGGFSIALFE